MNKSIIPKAISEEVIESSSELIEEACFESIEELNSNIIQLLQEFMVCKKARREAFQAVEKLDEAIDDIITREQPKK